MGRDGVEMSELVSLLRRRRLLPTVPREAACARSRAQEAAAEATEGTEPAEAPPTCAVSGMQTYCGWTNSISHHLETMGNHCLLVFIRESSCQGFLGGAAFGPSTVLPGRQIQPCMRTCGHAHRYPHTHTHTEAGMHVPMHAHNGAHARTAPPLTG